VNVPSFEFLGFAALVAIVLAISTKSTWRRLVFAIANVAFVLTFTHDPLALAPFAGFLALGYASVKLVESRKRRTAFITLVVAIVLAFCWLKRYTFIPSATFLPYAYFTVGLSYMFFRVLHVVIDTHSEMFPEPIGPLAYLSYTLSFPSLVSGPIQLYSDYRRTESEQPAALGLADMGSASERIIAGLFKVVVLSPILLNLHQRTVANLSPSLALDYRAGLGALAIALFPIYLYINFSGYTDFVIGAARFMRLVLPENFNQPFRAASFLDFWSRWHMTLSGWLKRYVYTSVAMSLIRRFSAPSAEPYIGVFAYFVTFFLVGLWHGQTSMFIVYGVLQGLGVSANKLFSILMIARLGRKPYRALCARPVYAAFSRGLTFTYFAVTLLWFWSSAQSLSLFARTLGMPAILAAIALVVVGSSLILSALYRCEEMIGSSRVVQFARFDSLYYRVAWTTVLLVLVVSVTAILNAPAPHIVYKAF